MLPRPRLRCPARNATRLLSSRTGRPARFLCFRQQSTVSDLTPRRELESVFLELNEHASEYASAHQLQLALHGLRQHPGKESVRIAVLGLASGEGKDGATMAKTLLRLVLADPLSPSQEWEEQLARSAGSEPVVLRIDDAAPTEHEVRISMAKSNSLLREIHVSVPSLRDYNVELLVAEASLSPQLDTMAHDEVENAILVPTVDVPSQNGRVSPTPTPVHRALLVTDGFAGVARVAWLPALQHLNTIAAAVNIPHFQPAATQSDVFKVVDLAAATEALALIRQGPQKALQYERLWSQSNVSTILAWLRFSLSPTSSTSTQPVVRHLVASSLQSILSQVQAEEARKTKTGGVVAKALFEQRDPPATGLLRELQEWAQESHEELQNELDQAFSGRNWNKLRWWKLFWRVDDVALLASEMLGQGLLPEAEKKLIYLAGRVREELGVNPDFRQPDSSTWKPLTGERESRPDSLNAPPVQALLSSVKSPATTNGQSDQNKRSRWPAHISFTKTYLSTETIPALQALAQRLMLEVLSTSAVMTSFGGLLYASSYAPTLYEAGAVAALGIAWSLRRLQKQWERARGFWEGEVREEGRKAVRNAERSMLGVLGHAEAAENKRSKSREEDLRRIRALVARGEDALARMQ